MSEAAARRVGLGEIFLTFLVIGATSFGGGVVAYLRQTLVTQKGWLDDDQFMSALEISQTLPGLNATNMSVLVGSRLRGIPGAVAAFAGMCLPGSALLFVLGSLYGQHGAKPAVNAALDGVAAAATGLLLATTYQLGRKELGGVVDLVFVALTTVAVSVLKLSLPITLFTLGPLAIWWYRPSRAAAALEEKA
ncbi:MAG: chromate transporter [Deltaproteobacteria bacterium]|nr:chromate transporter [Deltaproteobacteria bacterium]